MQSKDRINDFVVQIATVNGTGSSSANTLLMKAIFRMGIPVVGKNYFPSNIQGLPTWYEIRATGEGYLARSSKVDIMVAMNAQTYAEDLVSVVTNGVLIYDSSWPRAELEDRSDITVLPVPLSKMCNESFTGARARILMKNIAYVGVIAALIEIDRDVVRQLLSETFTDKPDLVESNMQAFELGYDYSKTEFNCPLESRLVPMDAMTNHIMIDGNTAAALGCVYAGATVGSWYPITPSTSLFDAFGKFCKQLRQNPETGEQNYCIIQAEDCLLYTSPSPRDYAASRMPSSA